MPSGSNALWMVKKKIGVWRSLDSAFDWGSKGRRFKSCHPDFAESGKLSIAESRLMIIRGRPLWRYFSYPNGLALWHASLASGQASIEATARNAFFDHSRCAGNKRGGAEIAPRIRLVLSLQHLAHLGRHRQRVAGR